MSWMPIRGLRNDLSVLIWNLKSSWELLFINVSLGPPAPIRHIRWDDPDLSQGSRHTLQQQSKSDRQRRHDRRVNVTPEAPSSDYGSDFTLPATPDISPPSEPPFIDPVDWLNNQDFHRRLRAQKMEYCERCRERWFEMGLKDGVCNKCFLADKKKNEDEPFLYSAANNMDPGCIPSHLPKLTQIEEMVIARALGA